MHFRLLVTLALALLYPVSTGSASEVDPITDGKGCYLQPTPLCVFDLAHTELNKASQTGNPPASIMWTEDIEQYPDLDVREDAWRIVRDIYAEVATGYAKLGQSQNAQNLFDEIGEPAEIAARLEPQFEAIRANLDRTWLAHVLSQAANAAFPFDASGEVTDKFLWQDIMRMANEIGEVQILTNQVSRFEEFVSSAAYSGRPASFRGQYENTLVDLMLLRRDIDEAKRLAEHMEDKEQRDIARTQIARVLAQMGSIAEARELTKDMDSQVRSGVMQRAVVYLASHDDVNSARNLLMELDDLDKEIAISEVIGAEQLEAARYLAQPLGVGAKARMYFSIMNSFLKKGLLEEAARTARDIDEVGERAVAFAALSLAASQRGREDLVSEAREVITEMGRYNVDLVQIADSQIVLLLAYATLEDTQHASARSPEVKRLVDGIVGSAFGDNPLEALGASENQLKLLIELASAQFALGMAAEAHMTLEETVPPGTRNPDQEMAFILAEAAGMAYALTRPELGTPAVLEAMDAIGKLPRPMDRAMILTHLATVMNSSPQ